MNTWIPRPPENAGPDMLRKAYENVIGATEKIHEKAAKAGLAETDAKKQGHDVAAVFAAAQENAYRTARDLVIEGLVDAFELWEEYAAVSADTDPVEFLGPLPVPRIKNRVHQAAYALNASASRLTDDERALLGDDAPVELEQLDLMCAHPDVWGPDGLVRAGQAVVQAVTLAPADAPETPSRQVVGVMGDVLRLRAYLRALYAAGFKAQS